MATPPHLFADGQCGASSFCDIDPPPLRFTVVVQDRWLTGSDRMVAYRD